MALERIGAAKPVAAPPVTDVAKQRVFTKEARAPGWVAADRVVEAVFEKADLVGLEPGDRALFFRAAAPTTGIDVRPAADPPVAWDASTAKARFVVGPSARALEPGETGWVTLAPKSRGLLVVPSSAVLQSPRGPYVLAAATERGPFVSRPVEVGKVFVRRRGGAVRAARRRARRGQLTRSSGMRNKGWRVRQEAHLR